MLREEDLQLASRAAQIVVEIHDRLAGWLRAGRTLAEIDVFVAECLSERSAKSAFLGYKTARYPAFPSHACLSVNDVVVHGTAGMSIEPLKPGDLMSVDIGVVHRGWIGDAAWTYIIERPNDEVSERLCRCAIDALNAGIVMLEPGRPLLEWARVVQKKIEDECGFYCVEGLGGHGYDRKLHKPPYVANRLPIFPSEWPDAGVRLTPGMLLAVEPMVAVGTGKVKQAPRKWPILTADGSMAVHYEHDVYISEDGPVVLTAGLNDLPIIVGA